VCSLHLVDNLWSILHPEHLPHLIFFSFICWRSQGILFCIISCFLDFAGCILNFRLFWYAAGKEPSIFKAPDSGHTDEWDSQ
jgi:hypothetical protein